MQTFSSQLAATVVGRPVDSTLWLGYVSLDTGANKGLNAPLILTNAGMGEEQYLTIEDMDTSVPGTWTGHTHPTRYPVTVRLAQESDAVNAVSMSGGPAIPLPMDVLIAIHSNEGDVMPTLWAMSEDDGFVATMMIDSGTGIYVRYSGQWIELTDDDVVDGLTVTEVDGAALEMYDQFDRAGQLVHVSAMYKNGQPVQTFEVAPAGEAPVGEAPVTASVMTKGVPMLSSAEDLPGAIAAAEADPDLRWWVERRINALGLTPEDGLPWDPP